MLSLFQISEGVAWGYVACASAVPLKLWRANTPKVAELKTGRSLGLSGSVAPLTSGSMGHWVKSLYSSVGYSDLHSPTIQTIQAAILHPRALGIHLSGVCVGGGVLDKS